MKFLESHRIEIFEEAGIGLTRDNTVRLVNHSKKWREVYNSESSLIKNRLNIKSLKLHHCGSTAIPNIVAKPIIDIVGEVESLEELDSKKELLSEIGYFYKGEYGIKGRRYSTLYSEDESKGYCHLHIFSSGNDELKKHLVFKDYLIENKDAAKRYESTKLSLNLPRNEYADAKSKIINELLSEAFMFYGITI